MNRQKQGEREEEEAGSSKSTFRGPRAASESGRFLGLCCFVIVDKIRWHVISEITPAGENNTAGKKSQEDKDGEEEAKQETDRAEGVGIGRGTDSLIAWSVQKEIHHFLLLGKT